MSRIILTRHPNGEECLVAGWDAPLRLAFLDLTDDEGEPLAEAWPRSAFEVVTIIQRWMRADKPTGLDATNSSRMHRAAVLLREHADLPYPASNVIVDLTKEPVR